MPRVTKELQKQLFDAGVYPPRHPRGCAKNYARMLPTLFAAQGYSIEEIRTKARQAFEETTCTCDLSKSNS